MRGWYRVGLQGFRPLAEAAAAPGAAREAVGGGFGCVPVHPAAGAEGCRKRQRAAAIAALPDAAAGDPSGLRGAVRVLTCRRSVSGLGMWREPSGRSVCAYVALGPETFVKQTETVSARGSGTNR